VGVLAAADDLVRGEQNLAVVRHPGGGTGDLPVVAGPDPACSRTKPLRATGLRPCAAAAEDDQTAVQGAQRRSLGDGVGRSVRATADGEAGTDPDHREAAGTSHRLDPAG